MSDRAIRQLFKYLNKLMMLNWRLGMGPYLSFWPHGLGRFLVLVHTGRKSGKKYQTPVNYAEIDGDIYVTAGFGKVAHWYKNMMATPQVELWLPDGRWQAEVTDVTGEEHHLAKLREVLKGSGFAAYAAGVNPHKMSDDALSEVTEIYRLLRIRRVAPLTGKGGPGDLSWFWPAAVHGLLLLIWRNRKKRVRQAA